MSCSTAAEMDKVMSNPESFNEIKNNMREEARKIFFSPYPREAAEIMDALYSIGNTRKVPVDSYAQANARMGEFMRTAMRGDYAEMKELILTNKGKLMWGEGMGMSLIVGAAKSGLSVIDYLNQIYGTTVTTETKLAKSDGTEVSFFDAIMELFIEEWYTGVRKEIEDLKNKCGFTKWSNNTPSLPEIQELPFRGLDKE